MEEALFFLRAIASCPYDKRNLMKPKIYKIESTWILWVPGVRVYRFTSWGRLFNTRSSSVHALLSS